MIVIGQDGWMHSLDPQDPQLRVRSIPESFSPASANQLRGELQAEFGREFEVRTTNHFLVVQPRGRGERWPQLFEQSHRSFIGYMDKRGVEVRRGRFPMIAIVFPDEAAMYREFEKRDLNVKRVVGLYSGDSNRVMTHDGGYSLQVEATVRHEAAHQSAFNSGVHSRVNDTPRWITEGLGQMFEPRSMTDSQGSSRSSDRVNHESLQYLRRNFKSEQDPSFNESLMQLISDDSMFEDSLRIDKAYAVSWALMFYLAERDSEAFASLLTHTAKRPPFQPYSRRDRLRDIERIAAADIYELGFRVQRFLRSL
jgi:hypothetical protein